MSATKSNVEHRFEKNDKLTRNKSSRNKKDHQDLEESFLSMKLQPETSKREKTSFKINKCSKGKMQRDRRKMREKRRSTGVVYLGKDESRESGDTSGEEEEEGGTEDGAGIRNVDEETVKNTRLNESSENGEVNTAEQRLHPCSPGRRAQDKLSSDCLSGCGSNCAALKRQLSNKQEKIAALEKELAIVKEENKKLSEENSVLLRAFTKIK